MGEIINRVKEEQDTSCTYLHIVYWHARLELIIIPAADGNQEAGVCVHMLLVEDL